MKPFPNESEPLRKILADTAHAFRDENILADAEETASWTPDTDELRAISTRNRWASAAIASLTMAEVVAIMAKREITGETIPDILLILSFSVLGLMGYRLRLYSKRIQEIVEERKTQRSS